MSSVRAMAISAVVALCSLTAASSVAHQSSGDKRSTIRSTFVTRSQYVPDESLKPGRLLHCRMYFGCSPVPNNVFEDTED